VKCISVSRIELVLIHQSSFDDIRWIAYTDRNPSCNEATDHVASGAVLHEFLSEHHLLGLVLGCEFCTVDDRVSDYVRSVSGPQRPHSFVADDVRLGRKGVALARRLTRLWLVPLHAHFDQICGVTHRDRYGSR